jgi:predicted DsbA family dithiol-disulfide isomerase
MVEVYAEYFSDPLCPWCWAAEPKVRALRAAFGDALFWVNRMGGLEGRVPQATDPAVARERMEHVSLEGRMPIDLDVWRHRSPASSAPASVVIKAVGFQDPALEDALLRRVREAFFVEGRAVDTSEALLALAREVPGIDLPRLVREMHDRAAKKAFMVDWEAARDPLPGARDLETTTEGGRRYAFPTLVLKDREGNHRILDHTDPFETWLAAVHALAPGLKPLASPSIEGFLKSVGSASTEEVALACEVSFEGADADLASMAEDGRVICHPVGHFCTWTWKGGTPRPAGGEAEEG